MVKVNAKKKLAVEQPDFLRTQAGMDLAILPDGVLLTKLAGSETYKATAQLLDMSWHYLKGVERGTMRGWVIKALGTKNPGVCPWPVDIGQRLHAT